MKRYKMLAAILACCLAGCSQPTDSKQGTASSTDSTPPEVAALQESEQEPAPTEELIAPQDMEEEPAQSSEGLFITSADVVLTPTDDYEKGYVFNYGDEQFVAYFDTDSWRIYDSYKITNHEDMVAICQALQDVHTVYGSDMETPRTAEDMAYEWEQHNFVYDHLPEDSEWRNDAKDVDLDPQDQGKTYQQMYEDRTGKPFDIADFT